MMTFARFSQIWDCLVTDRPRPEPDPSRPIIHLDGASEQMVDHLIEAANGDFSHFDEIDRMLAEMDAQRL